MDESIFKEHANWAAFKLNSFHWPKSWQRHIYKVDKHERRETLDTVLLVWPRNPEHQEYIYNGEWLSEDKVPRPYLPVIEFDSMDSLRAWVDICERMR